MRTIIQTKNFELAAYVKGDMSANRLVLLLPGRADTKDYAHMRGHVDYLANKGHLAISFDPPGIWESKGGIEIYNTTNYIKAIAELMQNFGNRPTTLIGHSRGGTVAMLAGIENPYVKSFVAIMSYYGAPSAPSEESKKQGWQESKRDMPLNNSEVTKYKTFKLPMSYFEDGEKYNALEGLKTCKKPKLFFYGTKDILNDTEDVKKMYDVASEPKQICGVDSGHDYRFHPEIIEEINKVIGEFLDKH